MKISRNLLHVFLFFCSASAGATTSGNAPRPEDINRVFTEFESAFVAIEVTPYASWDFVRPSDEAIAKFKLLEVENWRILLSDIDRLPSSRQNPSKAATAGQIASDCEVLPPFEYLDLLDRVLDLIEAGKLPAGFAESCFSGEHSKDHFIAVNYEHPRVKVLIERAKKVCAASSDVLECLNAYAKGQAADNYDQFGTPGYPQTLPGIKLKRPNDSMIKEIEARTGKLLPHDPKFESRPERRGHSATDATASGHGDDFRWAWLALTATAGAAGLAIWKAYKRHPTR